MFFLSDHIEKEKEKDMKKHVANSCHDVCAYHALQLEPIVLLLLVHSILQGLQWGTS